MTEFYLLKWKKQRTADFTQEEHNALACSNAVAHYSEVRLPSQMIKRLISTQKNSIILLKFGSNVVHIFPPIVCFQQINL